MKIFIDTSAFYALADIDDENHKKAKQFYTSIFGKNDLVTSDYIIIECWFLFESRLGREKAIQFFDATRAGIVDIIKIVEKDLDRARRIIGDFEDQAFSLVDVTSFALMEKLDIQDVFSFDKHFFFYRFGDKKDLSFSVHP